MCRLQGPCQIFILVWLMITKAGSSFRPVVSFTPDWNKILRREFINMTCDVEPSLQDGLNYYWYKDNNRIHEGKTYTIRSAQVKNTGLYWCETSTGERSEPITLNVTNGPVILQAPVYIFENDMVTLRCHSPSGYSSGQTTFYRNDQILLPLLTDVFSLKIKLTDGADTYKCTKEALPPFFHTYSDETVISYTVNVTFPKVTFTPDWNKILTGESVTMTCRGKNGVTYNWFKDDKKVAEGQNYTISSACVEHSGIYQCRTNHYYSETVRLDVSDDPVILQAPLHVYKQTDLRLRCHSRPEYYVDHTTYYKGNSATELSNRDFILTVRGQEARGRYKCKKTLTRKEYVTYTDELSLTIRELFSFPELIISPYPVSEGDNVTFLCNTSLNPLRQRTELQFSIHKDGSNVHIFSSSKQYEIQSAQLEDSGNYYCEVRTLSNRVSKRSNAIFLQVQGINTWKLVLVVVVPFLAIVLLIVSAVLISRYKQKGKRQTTHKSGSGAPTDLDKKEGTRCQDIDQNTSTTEKDEVWYAKLVIKTKGHLFGGEI